MEHPLKNIEGYNVILASNSPRRKELLGQLGISFTTRVLNDIDESFPADMPADNVAEYISKKKSDAYRQCMADNELIITADTIVVSNNKILGKPVDADDAHNMLRELSGHAHQVITGVTITTTQFSKSFSSVTDVNFAELSDVEIDYYIENYKPFDKAGAYGIQEWIGCVAVSGMVGSYYNVMGLPIFKLYQELKEIL